MALQKEIWLNHLVEQIYADNSFMSKSFNADEFVKSGKVVHIPNASGKPEVVTGSIERPANAKELTDTDLEFTIDEHFVKPIYIKNADKYELSYDKRESVIKRSKSALGEAVAIKMLTRWLPTGEGRKIVVTRSTPIRKALLAAMTRFNKEDIPQEGRYVLLNAEMNEQLLESLTEAQTQAFLASADAQKGVVGKLYSFNVMMRSSVNDNSGKPCALAWHKDYVCRATGENEMFVQDDDPHYYGDVMSFLVRAGGEKMSKGETGVLKIVIDDTQSHAVSATEGHESTEG